jgi:hypothetical protein
MTYYSRFRLSHSPLLPYLGQTLRHSHPRQSHYCLHLQNLLLRLQPP